MGPPKYLPARAVYSTLGGSPMVSHQSADGEQRAFGICEDSSPKARHVKWRHDDLATELGSLCGGDIGIIDPKGDTPMRLRCARRTISGDRHHGSDDISRHRLLRFTTVVTGKPPLRYLSFRRTKRRSLMLFHFTSWCFVWVRCGTTERNGRVKPADRECEPRHFLAPLWA